MDESQELAPNGVRRQDLSVLITMLAQLEGALMVGDVPNELAGRIQVCFVRAGLLAGPASQRDLRQAINDLNHRLRYAAGQYEEPSAPTPVPD